MRLQIICRGSKKEGLGHLFRTRTFAKTAQNKHEIDIVAIVEDELKSVFHELPGLVHFVQRDEDILPYIQKYVADIVLFDLTSLEKDVTERAIKIPLLTGSLSPIFKHMSLIDICFTRSTRITQIQGVKVFGGLEYAIFNDHCITIDDITYERNLNLPSFSIAVCMGGTDAANKTLKVLKALISLDNNFTIWVLLGEGYSYSYDTLVNTVRKTHQHEIILAKTNQSMWRIMSNCALAILAGGITSIEAVYAGLPTINLFERQEHIDVMSKELIEFGACLNGGLFSQDSLKVLLNKLQFLYHNRDKLRLMRKSSKGLVDSKGSERVLSELERQLFFKRPFATIQFIDNKKSNQNLFDRFNISSTNVL